MVVLEVAVLDRLQAGDQQRGHVLQLHQAALFGDIAIQRGDAGRVEAGAVDRLARLAVGDRGDAAAVDEHRQLAARHRAFEVGEGAGGDVETFAVAGPGAGQVAAVFAVTGGGQLQQQGVGVQARARRQRLRAGIYAGRDLPDQGVEFSPYALVEHVEIRHAHAHDQAQRKQGAAEEPGTPAGTGGRRA